MNGKIKFFPALLLTLVVLFSVAFLSGNYMWTSDKPPLEIIDDMDNQPKVKPQTGSAFFADGKATREPLPFTVPVKGSKYTTTLEEADTKNVNPLKDANDVVLARGKNRYNAYCAPCHNYDGKGNGLVVQHGFSNPPNLMENAKNYSDGKIYHIISAGQNVMPAYSDKTSDVDRWCIVHYVRALQTGKVSAKPADAKQTAQASAMN
jgi:mono/diheme cytochrome c family protein